MEHDLSQSIEVAVSDARWHEAVADLTSHCRNYASAAIERVLETHSRNVELSLVLADDNFVHDLNFRYRGVDRPTNVLSFPLDEEKPVRAGEPTILGDVVLAYETVTREAALARLSVRDHMAHLLVHGVLHLLGRDHGETAEADRMEAEEAGILASLGIADPYATEVLT